ncbi:MAG: hypothetical protein M3Y08_20670, partial [Fibrobacterota bacterium]|nr:hypothetical protein [Fibrobacterota bacterium]
MLHYRGGQQAPFRSNAGIATVTNIPSYPTNDLVLKVDPVPASDFTTGRVSITVTRGTEAIDSIMVVTATQGGQPVDSIAKAVSGNSINFTFTVRKGTFVFYAVPLAKLNNVRKPGEPTPSSAAFAFQIPVGDTIFVAYKTGGSCPGADGTTNLPYCSLDSALKDIAVKKGGTVILKNSSPVVALEDITIAPIGLTQAARDADTALVTITNLFTTKYEETRPIFRGRTQEAITITRKNVILKGFFIEMPVGSVNTAVNVKASGAQIEGNIFRASAKGPVEGLALNVDVGAGDMRFLNNVVWGFTRNVQITTPGSTNIRIINNTFVEDLTFANAGKTTGIQASGTGAIGTIIANNFFSGIANAIDASLAVVSTPPTLDHNVFTSKQAVNITNIGDPDPASRMSTPDIWGPGYVIVLEGALAGPIECTAFSPCSQLYAGSSTTGYNATIDRDVFGKLRTNKKEVGAFEAGATGSVMGVLQIDVDLGATEKQMGFVVTGKTFDAADADSVYVFWSTSDLATVPDPFNSIPESHRNKYPISKLTSGNFSDVADGITIEAKRYYFYAALGKTTDATRKLGYKYSDTLTSDTKKDSGDCDLKDTKSACPSLSGRFISTEGIWARQFETRVDLTEAVTSGLIKNPRFESIQTPNVHNLDLNSPLPKIMFTVDIPGLGEPGSKQMFTADIEMKATPDLTGLDLFLLPTDANGLASYVPSWKVEQTATKTNIFIESSINGTQHYAFGKVQASMEPGIIQTAETAPQVFDFSANRDSTTVHLQVKFKGTGFKTANPLILVTPIPAGGTVSSVMKGGTFPSKTLVLSSGFSKLHDSQKSAWLYKYYTKAAGAEAVSTISGGHKKPFTLDSVKSEEFAAATDLSGDDLTILGGNLTEGTISVPFGSKAHKDYLKYTDQIGKATRSIEVEFTVFDGAKISRSRVFVRTKFSDGDVHFSERSNFLQSNNLAPVWNLYGYPWDEADTGSLARIVERDRWDPDNMRILTYKGSGGEGAGDFFAYNGSNPTDIKYDAGFASWSGATNPYTPKVSDGMSLDFESFS